jgi:hypothetical protein
MDVRVTVVQRLGRSVRARVAISREKATTGRTYDTVGHLTLRTEEWAAFRQLIEAGSRALPAVTLEVVDDAA